MLPIHMAALYRYHDCVTKLLGQSIDFDIDEPDDYSRTCLHAAACGGNSEVVDLLLASGADFNLEDSEGR